MSGRAFGIYIAEVDAVKAHYMNEYLKTGDTLTLNKVFRSPG